ncbi:uncharacterized protein [Musca autumnalis]|uniref:uncharacterized protein n=1 Tax=Musca autumnalis TaxID=221902 RepID=UPI003CE7DBA1
MSLDSFIRLADTLVGFDADLANNLLPVNSIHLIRLHTDEIKSLWTKIKSEYDNFVKDYVSEAHEEEESGDEDQTSELETIRAKFKTIYLTYCKCISKLSEISDELQSTAVRKESPGHSSPAPQSHSPNVASGYSFRLPPCDTEVFSGDYMAWPTFRDMFTAVYIDNSCLSSVEKLFHLVKKTKGEAKEIVQKSPLTNSGFAQAWSSLCDRYENKRVLVNGQLKVLFNLPDVRSESAQGLKRLQRDINSCISVLKTYDIDDPSDLAALTPGHFLIGTPILVPVDPHADSSSISILNRWEKLKAIHQTFCSRWKNEYLRELQKRNKWQTSEPNVTVDSLVAVIDDNLPPNAWRLGRISKNNMPRSPSRAKSVIRSSVERQHTLYSCRLCKGRHPLRYCKKFLGLSTAGRLGAVEKYKYCKNCLAHEHSHGGCFSSQGCRKCNRNHHTLLHIQQDKPRDALPVRPRPEGGRDSQAEPSPSTSKVTSVTTLSSLLRQNTIILVPTAVVKITDGNVKSSARCLLDSGASVSRISKKLADSLNFTSLTMDGETLCPLTIKPRFDSERQVDVMLKVDNRINLKTPSRAIPKKVKDHFQNLYLADSTFYERSVYDIILGADLHIHHP